MSLKRNPITNATHTAWIPTVVSGVIAVACIVAVIFDKLPPGTLVTILVPLLGLGAMARRM